VLQRVGTETRFDEKRFSVDSVKHRDGRPLFRVNLVGGDTNTHLANIVLEDIPRNRVHLRVRRLDVAESQELPFAHFLSEAMAELQYLGFIIADSSRVS
jgi:hypothetical protein